MIDGDEQAIFVETIFFGDQFPGERNRFFLEIIAEREIAEHFKKCVMARRIADILEVIMLAAGAHAFLGGCGARIGALFNAGKNILELDHARIGEHEGGVIARHQRRRGDALMAVGLEEIEKGRPDFVNAAHLVCARFMP